MKFATRCSVVGVALGSFCAIASAGEERRGWPAYQGGPDSIHYSSLTQINRDNVKDLQVAWTLDTRDDMPNSEMYCNPIVVDGTIYLVSPKASLIAADAATGKELWRFDPSGGRRTLGGHRIRGLSHWSDGAHGRIFFAVRQYLYAVDTHTGKPIPSFGRNGRIDLREHLDRDPATQSVSLTTPGVVYQDLLIVGSTVSEMLPASYGDIRAFDVRTGALRWTFHTIPRPGEFGYHTWPKDAWKHTGGANAWGGLSLDVNRGIVYAPTGSATFDWYSGDRSGDNLFANTLLALDAATGKRLWHFQAVHHDAWDLDLPSAPSLVTVVHKGRRIDAVAQPTKSGFLFLLDRLTGAPLFPVEERKVATDARMGEALSPTQPFPLIPKPFVRQELTEEMITKRTPEAHAAVLQKLETLRNGGPFTPLGPDETVLTPGIFGGAEWGGAAWDPESGLLYVNANDTPWYFSTKKREPEKAATRGRDIYLNECATCHGVDRKGSELFPSLIGLGAHFDRDEVATFVIRGTGRMPGFGRLGLDAVFAVADYVVSGKDTELVKVEHERSAADFMHYTFGTLEPLQDPAGYPGVKPPWGTLSAIDLNTGEYAWRVPLGEYAALAAQGIKDTGSENFGGAVVTAGGLLFIGATVHDRKFRAFDKSTGRLLWETTLPASAHATPAVYEVKGRQFVVIAAGGGKGGGPSGATYIAFALPNDAVTPAVTQHTEWARMRDGVLLASQVYLPAGASTARYPVVLVRSPYNAGGAGVCAGHCEKLAARGYAVVNQDVRGTSRSHGTFRPFHQERNDGYDAVEWAAGRPWSNGKVGIWGASYIGVTALQAAISRPPHLVAVVAAATGSDYHDNWTYVNGVFDQWFAQSWITRTFAVDRYRRELLASGMSWPEVEAKADEKLSHGNAALLPTGLMQLPLRKFADFKSVAPYYVEWLDHPYYDSYWAEVDVERYYERIEVPVLSIGGWYDIFSVGSVRNFLGTRHKAGSARARDGSRLIMGPDCHNPCNAAARFAHGLPANLEMSPGWWDYWLKGIGDEPARASAVQLFVMEPPESGSQGGGFWIAADEYPLPGTQRIRFALRSGGGANTLNGDGVLDSKAPASGPPDRFTYDPHNPAPTLGGNLCCDAQLLSPGVFDQAEVERREDVLVYSSAPLEEDLIVVGPVVVNFWAASSAPDTDFTAKLVDVRPDGVAFNILDRVINARLRHGSKLPPAPANPGQAYEYRLQMGDTAVVFETGHRIRLEISSSKFPHFARNPNTGRSAVVESRVLTAKQTVLHDSRHPSYLELPVNPGARRREKTVAFFAD